MLSSSDGLGKMADIITKKAKTSDLWTLQQEESFNKKNATSVIVNINSGNYEEIKINVQSL